MAVDIEVFDEYQQPAADALVANFERIREEREYNRSQPESTVVRNQLTVSDLDEFFVQRRERFASAKETLGYVHSFMANYTMDVAFIRGLQLYDGNISSVLGTGAQKEYESRMRSLWQLFELEQQYAINIRLIRRLGLHNMHADSEQVRSYLANILDALDHGTHDRNNASDVNMDVDLDLDVIRSAVHAARMDYELALLNTTAMQQFLHRVYLMGTNEAHTLHFQPLLDADELDTLGAVVELQPVEQRELFKYTRRIVDFRKRMSETVDRLQTIMQDLDTAKTETTATTTTTPPAVTPMPVPMPPLAVAGTPDLQQQQQQPTTEQDEGSVWSQLVQNILRKTTVQRIKFDEAVLFEKTRKSLEKHAHKQLSYELFSCRRPEYIEAFAYRDYYPESIWPHD